MSALRPNTYCSRAFASAVADGLNVDCKCAEANDPNGNPVDVITCIYVIHMCACVCVCVCVCVVVVVVFVCVRACVIDGEMHNGTSDLLYFLSQAT